MDGRIMNYYLIIYPYYCDGCYLFISAESKFRALRKFRKNYDMYIEKDILRIYDVEELINSNVSISLTYPYDKL